MDDAAALCPQCDALGAGSYCGACGASMQDKGRTCNSCGMAGTGAFCQHCGQELVSQIAEAIEADSYDWNAWYESLTPFLGGLTPQEEALMARSA